MKQSKLFFWGQVFAVVASILLGGCATGSKDEGLEPVSTSDDYDSEFMNTLADEKIDGDVDEVSGWEIDTASTTQPAIEDQDLASFKLDEAVAEANTTLPEVEDVSHQELWQETPSAEYNERPIQDVPMDSSYFENVSLEDSSAPHSALSAPIYTPSSTAELDGVYRVKQGDSLSKISQKLFGSMRYVDQLSTDNGISNPNRIRVGQKIKYNTGLAQLGDRLQADGTLRVKRGDTLSSLAKLLLGSAKSWEQIWQLNTDVVQNPNRIKVGQVLRIR